MLQTDNRLQHLLFSIKYDVMDCWVYGRVEFCTIPPIIVVPISFNRSCRSTYSNGKVTRENFGDRSPEEIFILKT